MRNQIPNAAFTLIEMLVSVAILSILGLSLTLILRSGMTAWRAGEARTATNATAEAVLDSVSDDFAAALTKTVEPPGTVELEIPTVAELYQRAQLDGQSLDTKTTDFYSNEWCQISADEGLTIDTNHPWRGISSPQVTFHFKLRFVARHAAIWMAKRGDVTFKAIILEPGETYDEAATGTAVPASGDLSSLISDATTDSFGNVEGTDHIAIRATLHQDDTLPADAQPRLMPGTEAPVLRFTAEPDLDSVNIAKFQLKNSGNGRRITFMRDFSSAPEPSGFGPIEGLGEVGYLTTFDYLDGGEESPTGILWRATRDPYKNYPPDVWPGESLFNDLVFDELAGTAQVMASSAGRSYEFTRDIMLQGEYYPVAENVLYFGVQAWDDDLEWPGWVDDWDPARGIPTKVRMILVLLPQAGAEQVIGRLAQPLSSSGVTEQIVLDSAKDFHSYAANSALDRFVKIGDEWIYYDNVSKGKLVFDSRTESGTDDALDTLLTDQDRYSILKGSDNNRGLRGTVAQDHPAGSDVIQGVTFVRTIVLPNPRRIDTQ